MKHVQYKKSILLLTFVFSPNIGGVESHLDDLTNYLTQNHTVTVITYKPLGWKEKIPLKETKKNLTIIRIPWFHPAIFNTLEKIPFVQILYLVPPILMFSFFYLLTHYRQIDILQVHGFNMAIVGSILSKILEKPLVVNTHVSFYFQKGSRYATILRYFLQQARYILVLTKESKRELKNIGIGNEKLIVYHQWIDEKTFNPKNKSNSRKKLKLDTEKFIVLFVGRFSPVKGISILVNAATKLHKNVQIIFVGSGPLASLIQEKSKETPVIRFVGKVPYEDLPFYYSAADTVIIPSTPATKTYSEGIPRVMIEAYRCGTPVIATKVGGVAEHVSQKTGVFIQPTSADIAKTINNLSNNKHQLVTLGKNATAYAYQEFGKLNNARIIEKSLL